MSTIPFFTTIPISMIAPIIDMMLSVWPVIQRMRNTPENANSSDVMMMPGYVKLSNWAAITMYTSRMMSSPSERRSENESCWSS